MTTQPTVGALETKKLAYSAIDLATTKGAQAALGGAWPAAGVLAQTSWVNAHKDTVQKVVDALVATMHWINTHTAADIANELPSDVRAEQHHQQGPVHRRPDNRQGTVPARRHHARRRPENRSGALIGAGRQRVRARARAEARHAKPPMACQKLTRWYAASGCGANGERAGQGGW